jgi:hypothetical protein
MQLLYASTSLGFGHTLRIALEGEGISAFCSDADAAVAGIGGPMAGVRTRVYVPSEDYPRAVDVLERMLADDAPPAAAPPHAPARRPLPMWVIMLGVACAIVLVGALAMPASAHDESLARRDLEAAEVAMLSDAMVRKNPKSQALCTREPYACVGVRTYELVLAILHASRHPDAPRILVDLSRYRMDAALAVDYACVVYERRAAAKPALATVDPAALAQRCAADVVAFQRKSKPGKWDVKPEAICRTPAEIRDAIVELRAFVKTSNGCD